MASVIEMADLIEGDGDSGVLAAALATGESVGQGTDGQLPTVFRRQGGPADRRVPSAIVTIAVQRVPVGEVAQGHQLDHRYATSANSPALSRDPRGRLSVI